MVRLALQGRVQMTKLDEAVQAILDNDKDDPWTALCVETVRLGAALARFDNARKAYVASQKEQHDTKTA